MSFSGFLNVHRLESGEWEYSLGDKIHRDYSLKNLEFIVRMHGLKWGVLDENLALKSLKEDENVHTGFLNVYYDDGRWCYRGTDLESRDLRLLEKKVTDSSLEWYITDKNQAEKSLNKNKINIRDAGFKRNQARKKSENLKLKREILNEKNSTSTGLFRVNRIDDVWVYRTDDTVLKSDDLNDLKKKVLSHNLEWKVLDRNLLESISED